MIRTQKPGFQISLDTDGRATLPFPFRTGKTGFHALLVCALWLVTANAGAHVGDPNVLFEGHAGPYPVRVLIRPPGVIPGLAEISVRVHTNGVQRVTALPMRWNSGRKGAPPPDEAKPVPGETNLYHTQLWFMRDGAQSVEVAVAGEAGTGQVIVPVNALATRVLGMTPSLGWMLALLGTLLVALAAGILGAAVRESVLPAGHSPTTKRQWLSRAIAFASLLALVAFLWFGKNWWRAEASEYRLDRLYRPLAAAAEVRLENGQRLLRVQRSIDRPATAEELDRQKKQRVRVTGRIVDRYHNYTLVPEHGKLMHLFVIREPHLDAFAHLHPARLDWKTFETPLPNLPAGDYRVYADVTYETGFADTLTATVHLPEPAGSPAPPADPDDGWRIAAPFAGGESTNRQRVALASNLWMEMSADGALVENRDLRLRFAVRDIVLRPVPLEHYMGMAGHLIVRRDDGAVFTHLHPSGSYSMSAQQLFALRADGRAPLRAAGAKDEPICKLPAYDPVATNLLHADLSFPYVFPQAGPYRLWVQVKVGGEILTGVFDVRIRPAKESRDAAAGRSG